MTKIYVQKFTRHDEKRIIISRNIFNNLYMICCFVHFNLKKQSIVQIDMQKM